MAETLPEEAHCPSAHRARTAQAAGPRLVAESHRESIQQDDSHHAARNPRGQQELIDRIHRYFDEINADPVVFRWKYKMDEVFIG
jgi:hypothetical protein